MSRPVHEDARANGLRPMAVGALSGVLAGTLFWVIAILVQAALTQVTIATYGRSAAVDNAPAGGTFLTSSGGLIPFTVLGSFGGLLYGAARARLKLPGVVTALGFAVLFALVLQPLLSGANLGFSGVAWIGERSATPPGGYFKPSPVQVLPPFALELILATLVFLEGLAIALFARLGRRLLPNLPAPAYAVIAAVPVLAFFALLLLVVALLGGGD
jgi:hypothetical protein